MTRITFFTMDHQAKQLDSHSNLDIHVVHLDGNGVRCSFHCESEEQAFYLTKALNNDYRNSSLNISLIDVMFLIWSLRLMTNLRWEELNAFFYQAIGIRPATVLDLFHEADRRVEPDGGASRIETAFTLKHTPS